MIIIVRVSSYEEELQKMKFEVDTDQLSATVRSLQDVLNEISDQRVKMYSAIKELDSMWIGEAHDTFLIQYENDNEMMEKMIQDLNEVVGNFGTARENYDSCEESVKDMIRKIRI